MDKKKNALLRKLQYSHTSGKKSTYIYSGKVILLHDFFFFLVKIQ